MLYQIFITRCISIAYILFRWVLFSTFINRCVILSYNGRLKSKLSIFCLKFLKKVILVTRYNITFYPVFKNILLKYLIYY